MNIKRKAKWDLDAYIHHIRLTIFIFISNLDAFFLLRIDDHQTIDNILIKTLDKYWYV